MKDFHTSRNSSSTYQWPPCARPCRPVHSPSCPLSLSDVSQSVVTHADIRSVPELQPQELVANGRIIADNNEISD